MNANTDVWKFPKSIEFWSVPEYLKKFEASSLSAAFTFDLGDTETVHSSFIGFMIYVKQSVESAGGRLILEISPAVQKLLLMLKILDHFESSPTAKDARKIA